MDSLTTVKNVTGTPLEGISSTENNAISKENGSEDAEISIFDAEKYFSEECTDIKRQQQQQGEKPSHHDHLQLSIQRLSPLPSPAGHGRSFAAKSLRTAPSSSSEASWNSQTTLLANNFASHRTGRRWSAAKRWFFRRNCCCIGGQSVQVKEVASNSSGDRRGPIVLMDTKKSGNRSSGFLHGDGDDRSQRHITSEGLSLSRFSITDNIVEIHHVRTMDAPRQQRISATGRPFINGGTTVAFTFPISDRAAREDDVGSDASSDLFEIESFSTQTTSCPVHCLWDSVDEDPDGERDLAAANGSSSFQHGRLSAAADGCGGASAGDSSSGASVATLRSPREAAGEGEGKRKSNGMMLMSCRPETAAAATAKCVVEGPVAIPLHMGGRPLPARQGSSQSSPLVAAG